MSHKITQKDVNNIVWKACDTFRGIIDPSQYKDYILTMLFLKYVTDVYNEKKAEYKEKLTSNLPVENFFGWCEKTLMVDYQEVDPRKFFSLSILLFDTDVKVEFPNRGETESIRMNDLKLKVPKLKITQKEDELFQIPPSNS